MTHIYHAYPSVTHWEAKGYVEITTPFETSEKELLDKCLAGMQGCDYQVGIDRLKRAVVMRKKGDLKEMRKAAKE